MTDPILDPITIRFPKAFLARRGFWKGVALGAILEVPAIAGSLWVFAQWTQNDPAVPFAKLLRFTALFAGVAAVLTAGGIGRLAGSESFVRDSSLVANSPRVQGWIARGRGRATFVAARAHAVASVGLILVAALPHRNLPIHATGWIGLLGLGATVGAATGAVIGLACGGPAPVRISDVVALARKPGQALTDLLDPEDLRQLGVTLRHRTGHLLSEMLEPAQPPPPEKPGSSEPTPNGSAKPNPVPGEEA